MESMEDEDPWRVGDLAGVPLGNDILAAECGLHMTVSTYRCKRGCGAYFECVPLLSLEL